MENFKSIPGGICAPAGFSAAGVHCGIRHNHSKLDLALIKADVRCAGAGCYTTNKVYGAPITVDREHLKDGYAQAIVVNSPFLELTAISPVFNNIKQPVP